MADKKLPPFQSYASSSFNSAPRTPGKALYIVLFILLIIVVGIGAAQFLNSRSKEIKEVASAPIEFEEPTQAPSPTPIPEDAEEDNDDETDASKKSVDSDTGLDRADISIVIQNGSGTAGAAGKASTLLQGLGYTIQSTGNADSYDYEETVIEVSATKKNFLKLLEKDLSSDYTIGETSSTYTGKGDALIIIGKE